VEDDNGFFLSKLSDQRIFGRRRKKRREKTSVSKGKKKLLARLKKKKVITAARRGEKVERDAPWPEPCEASGGSCSYAGPKRRKGRTACDQKKVGLAYCVRKKALGGKGKEKKGGKQENKAFQGSRSCGWKRTIPRSPHRKRKGRKEKMARKRPPNLASSEKRRGGQKRRREQARCGMLTPT